MKKLAMVLMVLAILLSAGCSALTLGKARDILEGSYAQEVRQKTSEEAVFLVSSLIETRWGIKMSDKDRDQIVELLVDIQNEIAKGLLDSQTEALRRLDEDLRELIPLEN